MLNRKIAVLLFSGAALAAHAGFAAADETDIDFWSKNPRNVPAEQVIHAPQVPTTATVYVSPRRNPTRGPVTNAPDQEYYPTSGGVPAS